MRLAALDRVASSNLASSSKIESSSGRMSLFIYSHSLSSLDYARNDGVFMKYKSRPNQVGF